MDIVKIVIKRSSRKTISIEINREGGVIVRAPQKYPEYQIKKTIETHKEWIKDRIELAEKRKIQVPPKKFIHGEQFLFQGELFPLVIHSSNKKKMWFDQGFYIPKNLEGKARELLMEWYKERARVAFLDRVCYHTAQTGSRAKTMRLSSAQTRWGSCSMRGSLNFNWRLIMAPPHILDYVVVHEIIHLEEHNHSASFWKKVSKQFPEYKKAKQWLKEYGHTLNW